MKKLVEFFVFNNAVPIAFGILFLGAAGAAAATPEVRSAVIDVKEVVQSIDNSRIVNLDVEQYPFEIQVTDVREDDENYYVTYTLQTIDLVDSVWQDILRERELVVSKEALKGKDLGLYATSEIAEVRESEKRRIGETQVYEKKIGASQKVVATVYSGLIGKFLDPSEDTFPNYEPVIPDTVASASSSEDGVVLGASSGPDNVPPAISIIGDSVVRHPKGQEYVDLGAVVTDNVDGEIAYEIFLDNQKVDKIVIDPLKLWAYVITYRATDSSGNVSEARREIVVEEIAAPTAPAAPTDPPEPEIATTTEEVATSTPEVSVDPNTTPEQDVITEPVIVDEATTAADQTASSTPTQ